MPAKLRVQLVGAPPAHAFQYANELRALVYVWIGRCRPERASAFHGANAPKPYAISPVQSEGDRCWFQVSLLDDRLVGPVTEVAAREGKLRLGQEPYTLVGVQVREEVTWEELLPTEVRARPRHLELSDRDRLGQRPNERVQACTWSNGGACVRVRAGDRLHDNVAGQLEVQREPRWKARKEGAHAQRQHVELQAVAIGTEFGHRPAVRRTAGHAGAALTVGAHAAPGSGVLIGQDRAVRGALSHQQFAVRRNYRSDHVRFDHERLGKHGGWA